ncbi:MAG: SCO family protein [Candidatus Eisenbacteria bacterium]|nr:SCO family protein [Candidatus Eisenbacteria bacterium]
MTARRLRGAAAFLLLLAACAFPGRACAQRAEPLPQELEGVGITEHLNDPVPLDLRFRDEEGRDVALRDYFHQGRPVVLALVYYECPMLCTLVLNGMVEALKEVPMTPGKEYEIVAVSFNPTETPELAEMKKETYLDQYELEGWGNAFHFLVGDAGPIHSLTQAVGFGYRWNDETQQFAHQAAIYVLTPDGRISRYLYGVLFDPKTVRLSILEAGEGRIGNTVDQAILYCFHYDPKSGRYVPAAMNLMRLGGVLTMLGLGGTISVLWLRGRRRHAADESAQGASS